MTYLFFVNRFLMEDFKCDLLLPLVASSPGPFFLSLFFPVSTSEGPPISCPLGPPGEVTSKGGNSNCSDMSRGSAPPRRDLSDVSGSVTLLVKLSTMLVVSRAVAVSLVVFLLPMLLIEVLNKAFGDSKDTAEIFV